MKKDFSSSLPNKYESFLIETVKSKKFIVSSEISPMLIERFAITEINARKILQRAVQNAFIISSKPFTFGKGQFAYLSSKDELNKENIKNISKRFRPPIYRLLDALDFNEGIISYYEALKITSSPEETSTSKIDTIKDLINILIRLRICYQLTDGSSVRYILYQDVINERPLVMDKKTFEQELMKRHYRKMVLDSMFIPDVLRWLRKINLIDSGKIGYRNKITPSKGALHNGIVWDGYSYTKTTGINTFLGRKANTVEKQTLVVLDVVMSRPYEQSDVDGFLSRIQINLNSVKTGVRKVMPIVVFRSISPHVQNTLNSLGFISFDIADIFGARIYGVIERISSLQVRRDTLLGERIEETIAETLRTIRETGQEENLNDIRGVLFEFLLYPLLKSLYPNALILHGKILMKKTEEQKEGFEYDYIIQSSNPKEIVIIELKGYSSSASIPLGDTHTKNSLQWFFRKTLPFARQFYEKEISEGFSLRGCFITSAGFYETGLKFLAAINAGSLKPSNMNSYYDGASLLKLLDAYEFEKVKKTVQKFYMEKETAGAAGLIPYS